MLHGSDSELLDVAAVIALSHHERWDGAGYPQGLRGDEAQLEARIAAVADVFDALTRERPYRPPLRPAQGREIIATGRGTHFDPDVVDAFFAAQFEIRRARRPKKVLKRIGEIRVRSGSPALRERTQRSR